MARLRASREVTNTRAPMCRAIMSAAVATPPPMPVMSTVSPSVSLARRSSRHAVVAHTGYEATSAQLRPAGFALELVRRHHAVLPVPAPAVLSEQPHAGVQHRVDTPFERLVRHERRVDHDLVAGRPPLHAVTDPVDDAGDVVAGDVGEGRRLRQPGGEPQVHVVERRGHHTDPDLAGSRLGSVHLTPDVLSGGLGKVPCLHPIEGTDRVG